MSRQKADITLAKSLPMDEEVKASMLMHVALLMALTFWFAWKQSTIEKPARIIPIRLTNFSITNRPGTASERKPAPAGKSTRGTTSKTPVAKPKKTVKPRAVAPAKPTPKTAAPTEKPAGSKSPEPAPKPSSADGAGGSLRPDGTVSPVQPAGPLLETAAVPVEVSPASTLVSDPVRPMLHRPTFDESTPFLAAPETTTSVLPTLKTEDLGEPMPLSGEFGMTPAGTPKPGSLGETDAFSSKPDIAPEEQGDGLVTIGLLEASGGSSNQIAPPKIVRRTIPEYPAWARQQGIRGHATYKVLIQESGTVSDVMTHNSTIDPRLAVTGAQALRRWVFTPVLVNGEPKATWVLITMKFTLN